MTPICSATDRPDPADPCLTAARVRFLDVKYHDMGATKHAADLVVRSSAPGTAKK